MTGSRMDINVVFIGSQDHVVYPAKLEFFPRAGELVTLEGAGNYRVLQLVHVVGLDDEGNQSQKVSIFVEPSSDQYHSFSQETPR